jgi:hypothetical protein
MLMMPVDALYTVKLSLVLCMTCDDVCVREVGCHAINHVAYAILSPGFIAARCAIGNCRDGVGNGANLRRVNSPRFYITTIFGEVVYVRIVEAAGKIKLQLAR